MEIVRIWLYKITEDLKYNDCKLSKTNQLVKRVVRGDFEYWKIDGKSAFRSNRKEADAYARIVGRAVETIRGYPAFMHDLGHRA